MTAIYIPNFVKNPSEVFERLYNDLEWKRYGLKPRKEYYCNDNDVPYKYGNPAYADTYFRSPYTDDILNIRKDLEKEVNHIMDVCFLNLYENLSEHIGWHADDSPEMDSKRPIGIISLGAERYIYFKNRETKELTKVFLENGSACIMPAGMQETHLHKIPKADRICGPRISLTFRGYVDPLV